MDLVTHIVRFDEWCDKCAHWKTKDEDEPCNECLCEPLNTNSKQPIRFEEKN